MKKNILNLTGAQELSKDSQQSIKGGITEWMAANCIRRTGPTCLSIEIEERSGNNGYYPYQIGAWCCIGPEPRG
ncbi:hypothetical protein [Flavobacterium sp. '19STA2R22 D10 B1']|uniref:hypothetical protein n=1 Tax=Flavobacterium aerium TaxID=3037261 RepID=UPI00278C1739|nr:hypothetical protein [Flavobacterium sp. '19STA2R22 D10 B1']